MRLLILSLLMFIPFDITSQNISSNFYNYSLEEGLSQSTVYAFLEDDLGYIWIGTRDGLNRFDNNKFVTYYPVYDDSNSISNRSVRSLAKDKYGFIWVGTDGGGVDRLNPKTNTFQNLCVLQNSEVCELRTNITSLEISGNDLFIGTRKDGLYKYDLSTNSTTKIVDRKSTIWDIKIIADQIFLATSDGVVLQNAQGSSSYLKNMEIRALEFRSQSELIVGTRTNGILVLNLSSKEIVELNKAFRGVEVSDILIDKESNIWMATDSEGLYLTNNTGEVLHHFSPQKQNEFQLQSSSIRTLFEDSNEIIWVGTNNAGLSNYHKDRFQFQGYSSESTNQKLVSDVILSFNELDNGDILIGTEQKGLLLFNQANETFTNIEGFNNESIIAIEKDDNGQYWVATDGFGLKKFKIRSDSDRITRIKKLENESILSLEVISENEVIAGAYQGFYVVKNDELQEDIRVPDYLKNDRVLSIKSINEKEVLIGTFSQGLIVFNKADTSFKRIVLEITNNKKQRSPSRIQVIYEDTKKRIWLGTYSGLYNYDPEKESFKAFTIGDGLPSDVVYGILEDTEHNLWLSTNSGISKFDTEEINFENFSKSDGLLSNEFNGGAYFKDSKERMYFGGVEGFTFFDPNKIKDQVFKGNVVVYEMNVDGKIYNTIVERNFNLKEGKDFIQFDFSYLNFINPDRNNLEYRLLGLSENWIPVNKRRTINFSGLSSGDYKFVIRAVNTKKETVTYSSTISFYIAPPFWKRWYFILGLIITIVLISYALFRYRLFYLLREEATRNRISKDLHDDLSGTLSSISFFSEAAKRDISSESIKFLRKIDASAIEAKEKINDIIWAIDPNNDDWQSFMAKCNRFASEMFESKGIEYKIELDDSIKGFKNFKIRHDLWLIFKEMITNIVRHSQANHSKVVLFKKENRIILEVEDNGIGLSDEDMFKGRGISNLKYRANKIEAILTNETAEPSGTRWRLEIKL